MMLTGGSNTMSFGEEDRNKPPTLAIQPIGDVTAGAPVTLTALVTDDGLPKPRPPAPPRPTEREPISIAAQTARPLDPRPVSA
jgi:hypothetical protein